MLFLGVLKVVLALLFGSSFMYMLSSSVYPGSVLGVLLAISGIQVGVRVCMRAFMAYVYLYVRACVCLCGVCLSVGGWVGGDACAWRVPVRPEVAVVCSRGAGCAYVYLHYSFCGNGHAHGSTPIMSSSFARCCCGCVLPDALINACISASGCRHLCVRSVRPTACSRTFIPSFPAAPLIPSPYLQLCTVALRNTEAHDFEYATTYLVTLGLTMSFDSGIGFVGGVACYLLFSARALVVEFFESRKAARKGSTAAAENGEGH